MADNTYLLTGDVENRGVSMNSAAVPMQPYVRNVPMVTPQNDSHEYQAYHAVDTPLQFTEYDFGVTGDPIARRMAVVLGMAVLIFVVFFTLFTLFGEGEPRVGAIDSTQAGGGVTVLPSGDGVAVPSAQQAADINRGLPSLGSSSASSLIAPVFTPEVMRWSEKIVNWAQAAGVDPNHAAIIMQIESCGDPQAGSSAGAQGLFQVMPFHFTAGEEMRDPDTNARRGLNYFAERMVQTNGDVGRAFAGYNGGHGAAGSPYNTWANETQRYFYWATGILEDVEAGRSDSPRLQEWLNAGGDSLCRQAAQRQGVDALLAQ